MPSVTTESHTKPFEEKQEAYVIVAIRFPAKHSPHQQWLGFLPVSLCLTEPPDDMYYFRPVRHSPPMSGEQLNAFLE